MIAGDNMLISTGARMSNEMVANKEKNNLRIRITADMVMRLGVIESK